MSDPLIGRLIERFERARREREREERLNPAMKRTPPADGGQVGKRARRAANRRARAARKRNRQ